jgi:hypothetical protein
LSPGKLIVAQQATWRPTDASLRSRCDTGFDDPKVAKLGRIRAEVTEGLIRLHQQHLGTDALERDQAPAALLAAIKADVVGTEAGGEAGGVEEIGIEALNLEPRVPSALFPATLMGVETRRFE